MSGAEHGGLKLICVAVVLTTCLRAQTPTQAASPGQSSASGTALQAPATSTQSSVAGVIPGLPDLSSALRTSKGAKNGFGTSVPQATLPILVSGESVTLQQALALAQVNEPAFVAAAALAKIAKLQKSIARAELLPLVAYHNQYLFTQSSHLRDAAVPQIFIANNAVHEYISQGLVTETLGFAQRNALAVADANLAIANARLEVSRRGLAATVIGLYFRLSVSQGRIDIQQRAVDEAAGFVRQTSQREAEREIAHADVLKAQLTLQQRQRDLVEARLEAEKAHLDLGVLLYPDPRTPYTVALPSAAPLPERAFVDASARNHNPELASAAASLRASELGINAARSAYLPSLVLNYAYGIDAPYFAVHSPDGARNLGYSASGTLDVPIWDWLATEHKVKQAQILRDAAKTSLSTTQRRLIANLEEFYGELSVAHDQLASLEQSSIDSRESLRLTRLRYQGGEGTVLEVVDAQNTLASAEVAFQEGTVRYQLALANLQTLTGDF